MNVAHQCIPGTAGNEASAHPRGTLWKLTSSQDSKMVPAAFLECMAMAGLPICTLSEISGSHVKGVSILPVGMSHVCDKPS